MLMKVWLFFISLYGLYKCDSIYHKYLARRCVIDQVGEVISSRSHVLCSFHCEKRDLCFAFFFSNDQCKLIDEDFDRNVLLVEQRDGCQEEVSIYVKNWNTPFTKCPQNYNLRIDGIPRSFYKKVDSVKTWTEARDICSADGYKLVQISSDKEMEGLKVLGNTFWIGLRQINKDDEPAGNWFWIGSEEALYKNDDLMMDNYNNDEDYGFFRFQKFTDLSLVYSRPFVCECLIA